MNDQLNHKFINSVEAFDDMIKNLPSKIPKNRLIAFDTETTGLDPLTESVLLIQIGTPHWQFVIDTRFGDMQKLKPILEDETVYKLMHNGKFDYSMIKSNYGIEIESIIDTMILEKILMMGVSGVTIIEDDALGVKRELSLGVPKFGLKHVLKKYLWIDMDKEQQTTFINHVGEFTNAQIEYAALDVMYLHAIFKKQTDALSKYDMQEAANLECSTIPVMGDMELNGMRLDFEQWTKLANDQNTIKEKAKHRLIDLMSEKFGPKAPYNIGILGIPNVNLNSDIEMPRVISYLTGYKFTSLSADALRPFEDEKYNTKNCPEIHDIDLTDPKGIIELYKRYVKSQKHQSSFGADWTRFRHSKTGRLHPSFNQVGTNSGRITGTKPNLLQIPATKEARVSFKETDDRLVITADYSGAELRIIADLSQEPSWVEAFKQGKDLHSEIASLIFGVEVSKTKNAHLRKIAKSLNFGWTNKMK